MSAKYVLPGARKLNALGLPEPAARVELTAQQEKELSALFGGMVDGTIVLESLFLNGNYVVRNATRTIVSPVRGGGALLVFEVLYENTRGRHGYGYTVTSGASVSIATSLDEIGTGQFPDATVMLPVHTRNDHPLATLKDAVYLTTYLAGLSPLEVVRGEVEGEGEAMMSGLVHNTHIREAVLCTRLGIDPDNDTALGLLDGERWLDYQLGDPEVNLALTIGRPA